MSVDEKAKLTATFCKAWKCKHLLHIFLPSSLSLSLFLSVTDFNQIAANKQLFLAARVHGSFPRKSRGSGGGWSHSDRWDLNQYYIICPYLLKKKQETQLKRAQKSNVLLLVDGIIALIIFFHPSISLSSFPVTLHTHTHLVFRHCELWCIK